MEDTIPLRDATLLEQLTKIVTDASNFMWGWPLLALVSGGGLYFMIVSRFLPFRHFGHAFEVFARQA